MPITLRSGDLHAFDVRTRMPFRYGIATMTHAPHLFVRLGVNVGGQTAEGVAADHLPPKWFTKDPARAVDDEVRDMARVAEHAVQLAVGTEAASPFDAWRHVQAGQAAWGRREGLAPLLTQFGASLVERALLDAVARSSGRTFFELLHDGAFGLRLGDLQPDLAGLNPAELLPARPLERVLARHTVGLADPLSDADIPPGERLDDGLPQSLEACVRCYGLRHFKIKLTGDLAADRARLGRVAGILDARAPADYAVSLDGNEQFKALDGLAAYWEGLTRDAALAPLLKRLLFLEQPLHRDVALDPKVADLRGWAGRPAVIIDESDADPSSLRAALALGYAGTSHKNCKGVFKSVANACLLEHRRRTGAAGPHLLSGEDLATIGPVSLLQDLAVCAALNIASVERNGHHYFAGLSMFPPGVQRLTLERHPDLYHPSRDGWPALTLKNGELVLGSVLAAPFGVAFPMPVELFPTLDEYRMLPRR